jgi:hypothetical protein
MFGLIMAIGVLGQGRYSVQSDVTPSQGDRYVVVRTVSAVVDPVVHRRKPGKDVVVKVTEPESVAKQASTAAVQAPVTQQVQQWYYPPQPQVYYQAPAYQQNLGYTYGYRTVYPAYRQSRAFGGLFGRRTAVCVGGVCY